VPAGALAYIRLPHLFTFSSVPKGDVFTKVLAQDEHQKVINQLHEKIYQALANDTEGLIKPLAAFWLEHTRTPIEFIVLSNERQQPIPRILMTTKLGFDGLETFSAFIQDWVKQEENLYLINDQIIKQGYASIASGPVSIELHYDASNKQLRILAGMGISREMMVKAFADLKVQEHPMQVSEQTIDSSHHGLFAWFNIENLLAIAGNTMPPEKYSQITNTPLAEVKALSAGIGVSNGKGRLKVMVDFNKDALSNMLPAGGMGLDLYSSGQPGTVVGISLTSAVQLKKLEERYFSGDLKYKVEDYKAFKKKLTDITSISPEEILTAFGPEVLYLQDELGDYSAIAVRDAGLYRKLLARWVKHSDLKYSTKDINGITLHYLQGTPIWTQFSEQQSDIESKPLVKLLMRAKTHAYWVEEEGYLVFAGVPQLLLDRSRHKQKVKISSWLKQAQRQDVRSTLMLISSRIQGSPEKLYYAYLQALLFISDITGADIDISTLPTAADVALPKSGTYGVQLSLSDSQVFAELVYENNPAEFVLGQNLGNIAVIGVLAAIAVPAYQDYTIRAKVDASYAQTLNIRRQIESYWSQHGKYPPQVEIDKYNFDDRVADSVTRIDVIPDTGTLVITLSGHAQIQDKRLTIQPRKGADGIRWLCRGDVPMKYRPRECR
jgi:Tfp pilus assembly major pilin PilA